MFSKAHRALADRMAALAAKPQANGSILSVILEGNYSTFRIQRDYLEKLYRRTYG